MAVTDSMFRLEPLNLLHVLCIKATFEQFKPMGNGLAIRLLD